MPSDVLTASAIQAGLTTRWLGRAIHTFDALPSTNTWLAHRAAHGEPHGALCVADVQTAGRGRLGRSWQAPPGAGLLFSTLYRPSPTTTAAHISMAVSAGVAAALTAVVGAPFRLKWPNDILLHDHKVAGILGEAAYTGPHPDFVVVGVGLNVVLTAADLPAPPPGGTPPTSILVATGRRFPRVALLQAILAAIEPRYDSLPDTRALQAEWRNLCATLGRSVHVSGALTLDGIAEDIAPDGSLLVRRPDNILIPVPAGDVTLRH